MKFDPANITDPGRRRRLIIILAVVFVFLATGQLVKAVGDNRVDQQMADLTVDLRADLAALDVAKVGRDALYAGIVDPPDMHAYFPRSADRMVGSWQGEKTSTFWFEVDALLSRRCVQVGLHDGSSAIDVFTPGQRVCGSGPG